MQDQSASGTAAMSASLGDLQVTLHPDHVARAKQRDQTTVFIQANDGLSKTLFTASISDDYFLAEAYWTSTALPSVTGLPGDVQPTRRLLAALEQVRLKGEKGSSTFCLCCQERRVFPADLALGQHLHFQSTL